MLKPETPWGKHLHWSAINIVCFTVAYWGVALFSDQGSWQVYALMIAAFLFPSFLLRRRRKPKEETLHDLDDVAEEFGVDLSDPYEKVVFVQGHRHSEPICAWPDCRTYLTYEQMAALPEDPR